MPIRFEASRIFRLSTTTTSTRTAAAATTTTTTTTTLKCSWKTSRLNRVFRDRELDGKFYFQVQNKPERSERRSQKLARETIKKTVETFQDDEYGQSSLWSKNFVIKMCRRQKVPKLLVPILWISAGFLTSAAGSSGKGQVDEILHYFECDNVLKNWIENSTTAVFDVENATLTVDLSNLQQRLWYDDTTNIFCGTIYRRTRWVRSTLLSSALST